MAFVSFVLKTFMPPLFSYGTLQHEDIQLSTFGRKLDGKKDLVTYQRVNVTLASGSDAWVYVHAD